MSLGGTHNNLWRNYESFHISHDGECDDIHALVIASTSLKDKKVQVDCVIGNPNIVHHHAANDKDQEMQARMGLTNLIFGRSVAIGGAKNNSEVSKQYVEGIVEDSESKNCLVLHTDSFKSLQELFNRSKPGQLKNVVIVSYGSVNIAWAMPKSDNKNAESISYQKFYESLANSGAKLVQVDAYPFLRTRNHIKFENTPVTHALLQYLDGPVGKKSEDVNTRACEKIRNEKVKTVVENICKAMQKASDEQKNELKQQIGTLPQLDGCQVNDDMFKDSNTLINLLNRFLDLEQHKRFEPIIKKIGKILNSILQVNLDRVVSIYSSTSLLESGLISDQIPAIIFTELLEGRKNGILKESLPMEFDGLDDRYLKFKVNQARDSLHYFKTEDRMKLSSSECSEDKYIENQLQYLDLCMASAMLSHDQMIEFATKKKLLESSLRYKLITLANNVKTLGYDLPKSYLDLSL